MSNIVSDKIGVGIDDVVNMLAVLGWQRQEDFISDALEGIHKPMLVKDNRGKVCKAVVGRTWTTVYRLYRYNGTKEFKDGIEVMRSEPTADIARVRALAIDVGGGR